MEDLLVLIWKRGRFSNETEQEEYFCKFSMIWPRVKGKRVASLKKFNGLGRSFVYEFIYIFLRRQNSKKISSFENTTNLSTMPFVQPLSRYFYFELK